MLSWIPLLLMIAQAGFRPGTPGGPPAGPLVRITSPLGRSGASGTIRIVAQVQCPAGVELGPVRFFIDGQLLFTDSDGAPYAAEWTDENPFERREISVAVADALGREVSDRVVLEPFDIVEEAQVTSVLVEASVQDKSGRFVKSLPASAFTVLEDGVPQTLDLARYEAGGRDVRAAHRQQRAACRGGSTSCSARRQRSPTTCRHSTGAWSRRSPGACWR